MQAGYRCPLMHGIIFLNQNALYLKDDQGHDLNPKHRKMDKPLFSLTIHIIECYFSRFDFQVKHTSFIYDWQIVC